MQDLLAHARARLRHEPVERRVRAKLGARTIVDCTRAMLVWEPRRIVPSFAVLAGDILADLSPAPRPSTDGHPCPIMHPAIPFGVHTAAGQALSDGGRTGAGVRLDGEER